MKETSARNKRGNAEGRNRSRKASGPLVRTVCPPSSPEHFPAARHLSFPVIEYGRQALLSGSLSSPATQEQHKGLIGGVLVCQ